MSALFWRSPCGRVELHHGDSLQVLGGLEPASVDLVLTDPPFAEVTHRGARSGKAPRKRGGLVTFEAMESGQVAARFSACARLAKRWLVATMEWRHAAELMQAPPSGWDAIRLGVWTKPNGAPQFTGDRPAQGWESIAFFHRADAGKLRWNGGGRSSVFHHPVERDARYPTQKPLALVRELVQLFSDPGDVVLDPFCGSGTSLAAALERGRRAVGVDVSLDALKLARERCEAELRQGLLFSAGAP